jgi:hypothetical protein
MQANISTLQNLQAINDNRTGAVSDVTVFNGTASVANAFFEQLENFASKFVDEEGDYDEVPTVIRNFLGIIHDWSRKPNSFDDDEIKELVRKFNSANDDDDKIALLEQQIGKYE